MKNKSFLVLMLLAAAGTETWALDPAKAITQYTLGSWQRREGLPQGSVRSITQTKEGYLWLGTPAGLIRFDGGYFWVYDRHSASEMRSQGVGPLASSPTGSLLMGTNAGLLRMQAGAISAYPSKSAVKGLIRSILLASDASLWVGTDEGELLHIQSDRILNRQNLGAPVFGLGETQDRSVWVGTFGAGLMSLRGRAITHERFPSAFIRCLMAARDGSLWVGTEDQGVIRRDKGSTSKISTRQGLPSDSVRSLLEDRNGNFWIGTDAGLSRFQHGKISTLTTRDGLLSDQVRALFEDREGNLWIGTLGGGLNQLRDTAFLTYTQRDGLLHATVQSIAQGTNGEVWIATNGGLNRLESGTISAPFGARRGISSVHETSDGALWLGTNIGLERWKDGIRTLYTTREGLAHDLVRTICEDELGGVWIGTRAGLNRWYQGRIATYPSATPAPLHIRSLLIDSQRRLWIGATTGLYELKNGQLWPFAPAPRESWSVEAIYEARDKTLWFGTNGGGLLHWNGKWQDFDVHAGFSGLSYDVINNIFENRHTGDVWIGGPIGIARLDHRELATAERNGKKDIHGESIGPLDGIPSSECTGGAFPSGFQDNQGCLWFATARGALVIDPRRFLQSPQPPPLVIESVRFDDKPITDAPEELEIDPATRHIIIRYAGLNLSSPQRVRYKYQLQGYDHDWISAGNSKMAHYGKLPPGNYRFRVISSLDSQHWSSQPATVEIYQRPLWYQTIWTKLAALSLALSSLPLLIWLRTRHLKRRQRQLESERARLQEILQNVPIGVLVAKAPTGDIIMLNRQLTDIVGASLNHGARLTDAGGFVLADSDGVVLENGRHPFQRVLHGETVKGEEYLRESANGGGARWVRVSGAPVIAATGGISAVVVTVDDVDKEKRAEQGLRRSNDELRQFAYAAAHDLQEPLRNVAIFTELLGRTYRDRLDEKAQHFIQFSVEGARRMQNLVRDLLAYTKVVDESPLSERVTNVNRVIQEVLSDVKTAIEESGAEISIETLPEVPVNEVHLRQLFQNLISNALKYRGSEPPRISISAERNTGAWRFCVADNGIGIAPKYQSQIFGVFKRLHGNEYAGTGIGLALCKKIVEHYGGRIWVSSNPGAGARFFFTLPKDTSSHALSATEPLNQSAHC